MARVIRSSSVNHQGKADPIGETSTATFNRISTIINAILRLAEKKGWLEKAKSIPNRQEHAAGYRFLTLEEWQRLDAELPGQLKPAAKFSPATGLRQSNAFLPALKKGQPSPQNDLGRTGGCQGAQDGKNHRKWVGDFRWHDFRHTFASWHVLSGIPLELLQKLGGWSDMRMLMKYAHLAPEYIAGYANNAKP